MKRQDGNVFYNSLSRYIAREGAMLLHCAHLQKRIAFPISMPMEKEINGAPA